VPKVVRSTCGASGSPCPRVAIGSVVSGGPAAFRDRLLPDEQRDGRLCLSLPEAMPSFLHRDGRDCAGWGNLCRLSRVLFRDLPGRMRLAAQLYEHGGRPRRLVASARPLIRVRSGLQRLHPKPRAQIRPDWRALARGDTSTARSLGFNTSGNWTDPICGPASPSLHRAICSKVKFVGRIPSRATGSAVCRGADRFAQNAAAGSVATLGGLAFGRQRAVVGAGAEWRLRGEHYALRDHPTQHKIREPGEIRPFSRKHRTYRDRSAWTQALAFPRLVGIAASAGVALPAATSTIPVDPRAGKPSLRRWCGTPTVANRRRGLRRHDPVTLLFAAVLPGGPPKSAKPAPTGALVSFNLYKSRSPMTATLALLHALANRL